MARTINDLAPETVGVLIYQLLIQIAALRADVERLQEDLAATKRAPSPMAEQHVEGVE